MHYFKFLKRFSLFILIGAFVSFFSAYIIDVVYYNFNFEHVHNLILNSRTELFLLSSGLLFILYLLFSSVLGSSFLGSTLLILVTSMLSLVNYYKINFRAEPLYPSEIVMIKELPFFMEMIGMRKSILLISAIVILLTMLVFLYKKYLNKFLTKFSKKVQYSSRVVGVIISIVLLAYVAQFNVPGNNVKAAYDKHASWVTYNQMKNYSDNGFVSGFLFNLSAPPMDNQDNYSQEEIENLYTKYKEIADTINLTRNTSNSELSNILFIMNESLSDPFNLVGIEANKDPLTYHRTMKEEALSGGVLSPSFGGGTANNEFQAITTLSLEPFAPHITSPFVQLTDTMKRMPSLAKKFNQMGYRSTAIHPYTPMFYKRNEVYNNLGFHDFFHEDNMIHTDSLSEQHRYISDEQAYKEALSIIEQTDEPNFIHLVTMQNHTPYANKYTDIQFETEGSGNNSEADAYFEDLYYTDQALEYLNDELSNSDESTLVVYWGDHLPGFYEGDILEDNDVPTIRETPLLIFSNTHGSSENLGMISPIFFINHVNKLLNLPVSPYEALLMTLEERIPALDNGLYFDYATDSFINHKEHLTNEAIEVLEEYSIIQYDVTTGNGYAQKLDFFDTNE